MEIKLEWDKTKLEQYLLYDFWQPSQAMVFLSGHTYAHECILVDFRNHKTPEPNVNSLNARDSFMACEIEARRFKDDLLLKTEEAFQLLQSAWDSGYFPYSRYPPEFFIDWALSKRFRPDWLDWAIDKKLYTPKELRNLPATILNTPAAPDYSTSWLIIQQATIAQFFSPRRNPDAKKEEVVDWIRTQALEAGLPYSKNIATTIFTIIKPKNNDPKKKRVEPQ